MSTEKNTVEQMGDWCGADFFDPDFRDDPYPKLAALRANDPVNLTPVNTWRISRYEDVRAVFTDAKTSMTDADGASPNFDPLDTQGSFQEFVLNKDGMEHRRLRALLKNSFGNKTVELMEDEVQKTVEGALDTALSQGGMDGISALAHEVPSRMICQIMGVPMSDRTMFNAWTAARTNAFFGKFLPPDVQQRTRDAGAAMEDYFRALITERKKNLGDDLLSSMIQASEGGDQFADQELIIQAIGVIVAGYETTIGLLGNGLRAFVENPDQLNKLRTDPSLITNATNECLRFDTPIMFNWRVLEEDYVVGGKTLPANAVIWQLLASANRDPDRFDEPDKFDITRTDVAHQAFGGGQHFCLGNRLAKMEARHVFNQFAQRTEGLNVQPGEIEWSPSFFRVMASYPITFN
ncbi:MAG: cytochrome P450 [Glaciecola sp.]|jgi:cytochrome P450|uniref:cytochrome P450 n=1 Tax=Congregibacter sp. TaxID=2744308 RepID=UPI0039E62BC1